MSSLRRFWSRGLGNGDSRRYVHPSRTDDGIVTHATNTEHEEKLDGISGQRFSVVGDCQEKPVVGDLLRDEAGSYSDTDHPIGQLVKVEPLTVKFFGRAEQQVQELQDFALLGLRVGDLAWADGAVIVGNSSSQHCCRLEKPEIKEMEDEALREAALEWGVPTFHSICQELPLDMLRAKVLEQARYGQTMRLPLPGVPKLMRFFRLDEGPAFYGMSETDATFHESALQGAIKRLSWGLASLYVPEYLVGVPLCFFAACVDKSWIGHGYQLLWLVVCSAIQLQIVEAVAHPLSRVRCATDMSPMNLERRFAICKTFLGVKVARLGIQRWLLNLAIKSVNVINTMQATIMAGEKSRVWSGIYEERFCGRWQGLPFGDAICVLGLPNILLSMVAASGVLHGLWIVKALWWLDPVEVSDAANLSYVGTYLAGAYRIDGAISPVMFIVQAALRTFMLWAKISLAGITWHGHGYNITALLAIALSAYALVPLLHFIVTFIKYQDFRYYSMYSLCSFWGEGLQAQLEERHLGALPFAVCIMPPLMIVWLVLFIHFLGLFACSSHNFSTLHGGCIAWLSTNNTVNNTWTWSDVTSVLN